MHFPKGDRKQSSSSPHIPKALSRRCGSTLSCSEQPDPGAPSHPVCTGEGHEQKQLPPCLQTHSAQDRLLGKTWQWCLPWLSLCPSLSQRHGILHQTGCQPSCRESSDMTRREPGLCTWLEKRTRAPTGQPHRSASEGPARRRSPHRVPPGAKGPQDITPPRALPEARWGRGLTGWTPGLSGGARRPSGGSARG